ncbi:MAG: folate family ECF transporter S component [Clostridia bacterium]|nr:folate family ECF transporter S component [Clostridia bacterium]
MSQKNTFRLCTVALLSALSIVSNAFAINLTPDISLSFTYLVSFVSGVFLGPIDGFLVGIIGDVIGCIIAPKGPYAPTVTLSTGLLGVLPWVMFKAFRKFPYVVKVIASYIACFLICSVLINSTTWYIMYSSKTPYLTYLVTRNSVQLLIVAINCAITCVIFKPIKSVFERFGFAKDTKKEEIIEDSSQN